MKRLMARGLMLGTLLLSSTGLHRAPVLLPPLVFKIADGFAADHYVHRAFTRPFAEKATSAAQGLSFELADDQGLGSGPRMLKAVQNGQVAIGLLFPDDMRDGMRALHLAEYPGVAHSPCDLAERLWHLTEPGQAVAASDLDPLGVHRILVIVMPGYQFLLGKQIAWAGLSTLRNRRIRVTTQAEELLVAGLDGVPLRIAAKDMAPALAERRIDGAFSTYRTAIKQNVLGSFQGGTVDLDFGLVAQVYVMSEAQWRLLTHAQQQFLEDVGHRSVKQGCQAVTTDMHLAAREAEARGVVPYPLDAGDRKLLRVLSRQMIDHAVAAQFAGRNPLMATGVGP